jgi:cytochrome c5
VSQQDKAFFSTFIGVLAFLVILAVIFFAIAKTVTTSEEGAAQTDQKAVAERIKPIGEVTVGEAAPAAAGAGGATRSGEEVVKAVCSMCHAAGVAGAPKIGDKAAWAPRIAQGVDVLVQHAMSGIRAMPPKGTCAACSDAEIKGAVEYLVSQGK